MTNWLAGMPDVELAHVYCSAEPPQTGCCGRFFQITDQMVVRSLLRGPRAGRVLSETDGPGASGGPSGAPTEYAGLLRAYKRFHFESVLAARDFVWRYARYDTRALSDFLADFAPDIIFSMRYGTLKMLHVEGLVRRLCGKPIVVYTGDDEYSLRQVRLSPVYWARRLLTRRRMRRVIPSYAQYFMHDQRQAEAYARDFGVSAGVLLKCGDFRGVAPHGRVHTPLRMVYAGKLYCNRWKTLAMIADCLRGLDGGGGEPPVVLDIYTNDAVGEGVRRRLQDGRCCVLHGGVPPERLRQVYDGSDIALHVEAFDLKNRLLVQHSFSTKVVDCLGSGCALMVVSHEGHAALRYFRGREAAMVASDPAQLGEVLRALAEAPQEVLDWARRGQAFGLAHFQREAVQAALRARLAEIADGNT